MLVKAPTYLIKVIQMTNKLLFFFLALVISISAKAQLSDLHYLPPLKQGSNNQAIQQQAIYLSTSEPTTFTVNVYRGTNNTPVASFNISNVNPAVYSLSNGDNNITLVSNANTGVVLTNSGLRFESPSGNRFYVNYRGSSAAQAASLTSKGRVALGTHFKWGGVPNLGAHSSKSNTLGIMATEDNTIVNVFGYDPDCEFRLGNSVGGITADTYQISLNANESFVFEAYLAQSPAHRDGWIGASIVSDKPIVISNGSLNFGRQEHRTNRDAGIDQPVPENKLGKEYVFVRGNGHTNGSTEFPLLIAIADNTQIFVNGGTTPIATIDNGDYYQVPSSYYSANTVGANMFIQSSKAVYAYQCLAGASAVYTQGLNFVAPVNCLLPDVMDNIPDIRNIAGTLVTGGVTIIAAVNTPDANITITDGSGLVTLPASKPVAGSSDWKTFFIPNLNGNVSVQSTGPMAVGFFGYNGAKGIAGYFSGFDTVPEVSLEIRGGSGCFVGSSIYEATSNFDAYQWYENGVLIPGANSPNYTPPKAGEYFVRGTKGPCTYDSQILKAYYCDPDIILNKTVDKDEILEGETATFTIKVQNFGVGPLTNLKIIDEIPEGLTISSTQTITGSWAVDTWDIGTLLGGETVFLTIEVTADLIDTLPLLRLANTARSTQDQVDVNYTEDNPTAHITVHNDFDNDGVVDSVDLDDDNDGIYDTDECDLNTTNLTLGATASSSSVGYGGPPSRAVDNNTNGVWQNQSVAHTRGSSEHDWIDVDLGSSQFIDDVVIWNRTNCCMERLTNCYVMVSETPFPNNTVVEESLANAKYVYQIIQQERKNSILIGTSARYIRLQKSGDNLHGNYINIAEIQALQYTYCDADNDNLYNHLDLDSDDDGCSDANEFYSNGTADGGDNGVYGEGDPTIDPQTGIVLAADYTEVVRPEIKILNNVEDLGGVNIDNQGVNLDQSLEYVLRFQNIGKENGDNFVIHNELPDNVSLDNVDISATLGTTYNYDGNTNVITFNIPNELVIINSPEYSIRIRVTISDNCSNFLNACSSILQNTVEYSYQGVSNTTVFGSDNGNGTLTCAENIEVAQNTIQDDLENCGQQRTVQLCGDNVLLSAGSGFVSYRWILDTNDNGLIDNSDTVLNDGNPDNDTSTQLVSTTGGIIIEKTSDGSCPNMVEHINVERFGSTQTNPIIDYFNQVNSDTNIDNDLQGEIVTCAVDGDTMPNIFLCGSNDEATIQLGISDAQSIIWEKLNTNSCEASVGNCSNKNGSCVWNSVSDLNDFTITESGEYRVVIVYQNGCFSRFYFSVFRNELDINYLTTDILCETPGNILVTGIGSGYGYQLINSANDSILVPFLADNGPSFDITENGSYRIQITQINTTTDNPIEGSCVFETEDIGILDRNFEVNLSTNPADCNSLGAITIHALNAQANYSYELRLNDGSNNSEGTLISSQPTNTTNNYTFNNVNPGNYIVISRTQDGCFDSQTITVTEVPALTLAAVTTQNISCLEGVVELTPAGGVENPEYEMAIWNKNGTDSYAAISDIPEENFSASTTFRFGYHGLPATYVADEDGDYIFVLRDRNGCYQFSNEVHVADLGDLEITASHSQITCADAATSELTISVTGGTAPYQYSLDGGENYQTTNIFYNLAAGIHAVTVLDASGMDNEGCITTIEYEIDQPFRLTASASIIEDASCNPNGSLVKILNPSGGQAPYTYSFDGASTFTAVNESYLTSGNYELAVQDALGCIFDIDLNIPNTPADPTFNSSISYDCEGLAELTITSSNSDDFNYTYALNGTENTPSDNNIFNTVTPGTHMVTVGYSSALTPNQSTLLFENFGAGPNTQIEEIGNYCYEPQDGTTVACNLGPAGILVNGEYTVTSLVTNPIGAWRSPNDHTGLTDGRFLSIDVSTLAGDKGILWARRGISVQENSDLTISFWAYNLQQASATGNNPEVLIELVDANGTVIESIPSSEIPKNNNTDDWHNREVTINPGANSAVDLVFRTNLNSDFGNDLILDDIQVVQLPEVCNNTTEITIVVEENKEFSTNLLGTIAPSCNGSSDGAARFEVLNFDPITGYEYSTDGGTNWTSALVSPITTSASLTEGSHTILVRKINDTDCDASFDVTLTQPEAITPQLTITEVFTCFNNGATLEASVTGGTPTYEYQLETDTNTIITAYQTSSTFYNIPEGNYLVRVRDNSACTSVLNTPTTVLPPEAVEFDLNSTACYDGLNNATIIATVTSGNGNYLFRINGGAWTTPAPTTGVEHIFSGLANGNYEIEVTDALNCISGISTITVQPTLLVSTDIANISSCANGSITLNATGGDNNYAYAIVESGTTVSDSHFSATYTATITNATVDYDVYVRDNNGNAPYCQFTETVSIETTPPLEFTPLTTNATCFGDKGSIEVTITSGQAPFSYELVDIDNSTSSQVLTNVLFTNKTYYNLNVGTYDIIITDAANCATTMNGISITQPEELVADISGITPETCTGIPSDFGFRFDNYPTSLGTIEFSADGGTTWTGDNSTPGTTDRLTGHLSGTTVYPSLRTVDGSGTTVCQIDLAPYVIPYPLDDLDITLLPIIVNCDELQVTVRGANGTGPYEYTYAEDTATFNPASPSNGWTSPLALGVSHTFPGLVPGRTYAFYVRDAAGCIRQSSVNVNDIVDNPMEISAAYEPSCSGSNNGEIIYTITDADNITQPQMTWTLYDVDANIIQTSGTITYTSTVTISNLPADTYYLEVTQLNGGTITCTSGSENLLLEELDPITANLSVPQNISCESPGIILVSNIEGGGGEYTYTITGPDSYNDTTTDNPIEIPANSADGTYVIEVNDQYNCSYTLGSVALELTENPTITTINVSNCEPSATATITANSSSTTLLFSLNGTNFIDNGGVFENLLDGNYTVTVKDGNGCTVSQAFDVHPTLQANASLTKSLGCGTGQEAEIEISISEGSNNYDYEITATSGTVVSRTNMTTDQITAQITSAGSYTITVYDNNTNNPECNRSFTVEVPEAILPDFSTSANNVTCFNGTDGAITITQTNNGNNPLTFTIDSGAAFNMSTSSFENLTAGTYDITATGPNGCTETVSVAVTQPTEVTFAIPTVTPFGCASDNTSNNAVITIDTNSINGGSSDYVRYEFINNGTGDVLQNGTNPEYIFTDFAGATVSVTTYDNNGCSGNHLVTVAAFDKLVNAEIEIASPISCSDYVENIRINVTGSLTDYVSNPTNYEFKHLPTGAYQTSNMFIDLAPGSYTFMVRNTVTNCQITVTHSVADPNTFSFSIEKLSDVICHGENGSIRITMDDATYASSFVWNIYNTNGTPADRNDDGPSISNGNSPDFGPTTAIDVPAGSYLIEVIQDDFPACSQVQFFTISSPPAPITLTPIETTDVGCSNDQGTSAITPTGGQAPYNITLTNTITNSILDATAVTTSLFQELTSGIYDVIVTDALGCVTPFIAAFELVTPDPISGSISATALACEGDTDAEITFSLNPRNVNSNYRYTLNSYSDIDKSAILNATTSQTIGVFPNQKAGFYTVSVVDDMDCSFESEVVEIINPTEVSGMLTTVTTLSCQNQAVLKLTATGGTEPYQWSVDGITFTAMNQINGANTHVFENIAEGTYQYYLQDSYNCVSTFTNEITINPIEDLVITVDDASSTSVSCNGESSAVIISNATGGLGNYQFGLFSDVASTIEVYPYQDSGIFSDLTAGTYYINVQSGDCSETEKIEIEEPELLVITPSVSHISCNGGEDGSVTLNAEGGSGNYQYAISPNLNQFIDTNSFENLMAGDYSVIIQDSNGCFELIEFTITEPEILEMELSATSEICANANDGTISITVTGGTAPYSTAINSSNDDDFIEGRLTLENLQGGDYIIYVKDAKGCTVDDFIIVAIGANLNATAEVIYECTGDLPNNSINIIFEDESITSDVLYALDSSNSSDLALEPNFENLAVGNHFIYMVHANGCENNISFTVEEFEPLQLTLEQPDLNEIKANVTGGKESYTFYFEGENNEENNIFNIQRTDTYAVRVIDANGCESLASIYIEFIDIEIPNFFTPDGDGKNDIWLPKNIQQFPDIYISIFDRYGRHVYSIKDTDEGWDGLYKKADLPTGDYWYVIKLNGVDDTREFVGHFTLYR